MKRTSVAWRGFGATPSVLGRACALVAAVSAVAGCFPDPPGANDIETGPDTVSGDTGGGDTSALADTGLDDGSATDTDTAAPDTSACPNGCGSLDGPCQVGVCSASGCVAEPRTGTCDDGLACTTGDHCEAGVCVGAPIVCVAKDSCHIAGVCDPGTGRCSEPRKADTTPCDDGDVCTEGEACAAGVCQGGTIPDDSGDWVVKVPEVGNQALWVDEAGDVWWFVSISQPETDFGERVGGGRTALRLPEGATHGVGVVHFTRAGAIVDATLLAHSASPLKIPARALAPVRVERVGGAPLLMVAMAFEGAVGLGQGERAAVLELGTEAPVGYVAAYFRQDASLEAKVAFQADGMLPDDNLQYGPLGVAWGAGGALALAVPVLADRLARIEALEFRGPLTSSTSQVVVRFPGFAIGPLWQRVLVGTSAVAPFVPFCSLAFDGSGNLWIAATYAGQAAWRRVDGSVDLDRAPDVGNNFAMLRAKVTGDARLTAVSSLYSEGGLPMVTSIAGADHQGGGHLVAFGRGLLREVGEGGQEQVVADVGTPSRAFQAVIKFDADGAIASVDFGANVAVLLLGSSGGEPWALVGSSDAAPEWSGPMLEGVGPWLAGLASAATGRARWAVPISKSGVEVAGIAVGQESAIVASVVSHSAGGTVLNTSSDVVLLEGQGAVAKLNSEQGLSCRQR